MQRDDSTDIAQRPQASVAETLQQWRDAERAAGAARVAKIAAESAAATAEEAARAAQRTADAAREALEAVTLAEASAHETAESARRAADSAADEGAEAGYESAAADQVQADARERYGDAVDRASVRQPSPTDPATRSPPSEPRVPSPGAPHVSAARGEDDVIALLDRDTLHIAVPSTMGTTVARDVRGRHA